MYLAIREMRFAKARYSLVAAIMALIAFLVLFVTGLAQGLAYDNASSVQNMEADHFVLEQHSNHRFTRSQIDGDRLAAAGRIVGEENAEPLGVRMTTVIPLGGTKKADITILAVEPSGWLAPAAAEGAAMPDLAEGQVLIDRKLAVDGIGIGSVLVDQASGAQWTVGGIVENESFSHTPAVFMDVRDRGAIQTRTVNKDGASSADRNVYNAIALKGSTGKTKELQAALPGTEIVGKSEAVSAIPGYKEEQGSLNMMIIFLFVISAVVLAVFFYIITIQKTSQFGILKAIGAHTVYLARSVTLQVLLLSVGSLAVSSLLVQGFEAVLPDAMPFRLGLSALAWTCIAFIVMSLAGSLLSVWKVARIDALDAIGRTAV